MPLRKLQERLQYERTTGARLLLLWASLLWAVSLLLPGNTLARPPYHLLAEMGTDGTCAALFGAYALALTVPYRAAMRRWLFVISVHVLGVVLWVTVSACMLAANGLQSAAVMPNIALALASCWVLRNAPRCPRPEESHG